MRDENAPHAFYMGGMKVLLLVMAGPQYCRRCQYI